MRDISKYWTFASRKEQGCPGILFTESLEIPEAESEQQVEPQGNECYAAVARQVIR